MKIIRIMLLLVAGDRVVLHPSDRVSDGAAVAKRETR